MKIGQTLPVDQKLFPKTIMGKFNQTCVERASMGGKLCVNSFTLSPPDAFKIPLLCTH